MAPAAALVVELCRQILAENPSQLLLLDYNEFGLYTIHQELEALGVATCCATTLVPLLSSVRHSAQLAEVCGLYKPQVIFVRVKRCAKSSDRRQPNAHVAPTHHEGA